MTARGEKYQYSARVKEITPPSLRQLATSLNFLATTPGRHYGDPSPGDLLDALAAAYATDPTAVVAALRALGIEGAGPPPPQG